MNTPSHSSPSQEYISTSGRLSLRFSLDFEKERVLQTLTRLAWYREHGYSVTLPEEDIEKEFATSLYEQEAHAALTLFELYEDKFFHALQSLFGNKAIPKSTLYLTQYGTGGSYQLPNSVIVNIRLPHHFGTVFHELLHLHLEPYIKHYHISHWVKERTVDLLQMSPAFSFLPPPRNTSWNHVENIVDPLFEQYFFHNRDLYFSQLQDIISRT